MLKTQPAPTQLNQTFEQQGYIILRGVIEPTVLDQLRAEAIALVNQVAQHLAKAGHISHSHDGAPFEVRLAKLIAPCPQHAPKIFRKELHRKGFFDLFWHPEILRQVETLLGPELRLYPNYSVRPKLPAHSPTQVLWHQDGGYTANMGNNQQDKEVGQLRMVNLWTPLVPATTENGCMQFIPGTHRLGPVPHAKREFYLEIVEEVLKPRLNEAVDIELNPGDVVLFHNLLFHMGLPNRSDHIRWSIDWRYQDATQDTLRKEKGHLVKSRLHSEEVVRSADRWANLRFG